MEREKVSKNKNPKPIIPFLLPFLSRATADPYPAAYDAGKPSFLSVTTLGTSHPSVQTFINPIIAQGHGEVGKGMVPTKLTILINHFRQIRISGGLVLLSLYLLRPE
jgi:hypothetical protein